MIMLNVKKNQVKLRFYRGMWVLVMILVDYGFKGNIN